MFYNFTDLNRMFTGNEFFDNEEVIAETEVYFEFEICRRKKAK